MDAVSYTHLDVYKRQAMVEEFALQGAKVAFLDLAAEPAEELIRSLEG